MGYVFVSYSHKDKDYAHSLADELARRGIKVWIDDRIDYGSQWPKVIERSLDGCEKFIVVLSENSRESKWVQNEIARADRKKKPIYPLLLNGEPWLAVEAIHYVDVKEGQLPPERFYEQFEQGPISTFLQGPDKTTKTGIRKIPVWVFISLISVLVFLAIWVNPWKSGVGEPTAESSPSVGTEIIYNSPISLVPVTEVTPSPILTSTPEEQGRFYMIVLDASQDMMEEFDGQTKWDAAVGAVMAVLELREEDANYGLIVIGGFPTPDGEDPCSQPSKLAVPFSPREDIIKYIKNLKPAGGGSIFTAFNRAINQFNPKLIPENTIHTLVFITGSDDACTIRDEWRDLQRAYNFPGGIGVELYSEIIVLEEDELKSRSIEEQIGGVSEELNVQAPQNNIQLNQAITNVFNNITINVIVTSTALAPVKTSDTPRSETRTPTKTLQTPPNNPLTSTLTKTITPTFTRTSTPSPVPPISCIAWEFENPGDTEGWYKGPNVGPIDVHNGSMFITVFDSDAYVFSPKGLSIDTFTIKRLEYRYQVSGANDTLGQFIWGSEESPGVGSNYQWVDFEIFTNNGWQTLNLNLANFTRTSDGTKIWSGTVTQVRLDPVKYADTGTIEVDYIRLCP